MKIKIKDSSRERPIVIPLPLCLVANPISSLAIAHYTDILSFEDAQKLMKALRKSKKLLRGTPLVEVQSADGDEVTVWL